MKICSAILCSALVYLAGPARAAVDIRWQPEQPTFEDVVRIEIEGSRHGGILHWGVNAEGNVWEQAIPDYRPGGSVTDGVATRTRLEGPDDEGRYHVQLGPFNHTNQPVAFLNFVIHWDDGRWDNNAGDDYHIPITLGRITIDPPRPTINDVITVTIHRSDTNGLLRWGVNAQRGEWSPPFNIYWPDGTIPSDDGLAADTPISAPDEHGRSHVRLGPFNQGAQVVTSLHMAVHWDDTWDTDFGRNYNTAVVAHDPDAPRVRFLSPRAGEAVNDEMPIRLSLEDADQVDIWMNGRPAITLIDAHPAWTASLHHLEYGMHTLVARAERDGRIGMQQVDFWRVPRFEEKPCPAGTPFGATEQDDGTVTFALYAPGKQFVSLIGDFNGWDPTATFLHRAPGGIWWVNLPFEPGRYEYQYLINNFQKLADPYAREVNWSGPDGRKDYRPWNARTVLRVGEPPFEWTATDYQRPSLEELVIYELYIHDLCPGEGFTGVIARLDYIRDLGFNAIEPLPWHPFPGVQSWGYNPAFHLAVEQTYGTPDDLKRLIDEAHRRGMAVIIDMVLNHMDWNGPLYQLYGPDYDASPYFREFRGHNWGFPKVDQESEAVKRYVADVIRCWIEEYRIDGFRYDATRWTGWQGYNDWGASWYAFVARQADEYNIQIAEHLPTDPDLMIQTEMDAGWHSHFRWRLREMLTRAYLHGREFERIMDARRIGFDSSFQLLPYTESHDEERVVRELREAGYVEDDVFRRAETALAITLTAPGIPMIYAGQEFGEATKKVVGWNPLNWNLLDEPRPRRLHEATRTLVRLRTAHPALREDNLKILLSDESLCLVAYERATGDDRIAVLVNLGRYPQTVRVDLGAPGPWWDVLGGGDSFTVEPENLYQRELEPGQAVVLSSMRIDE